MDAGVELGCSVLPPLFPPLVVDIQRDGLDRGTAVGSTEELAVLRELELSRAVSRRAKPVLEVCVKNR